MIFDFPFIPLRGGVKVVKKVRLPFVKRGLENIRGRGKRRKLYEGGEVADLFILPTIPWG